MNAGIAAGEAGNEARADQRSGNCSKHRELQADGRPDSRREDRPDWQEEARIEVGRIQKHDRREACAQPGYFAEAILRAGLFATGQRQTCTRLGVGLALG